MFSGLFLSFQASKRGIVLLKQASKRGIIPTVIAEDIAKKYPDLKPYKIEKEVGGYEIDIPGYDLYYRYNGMFIRAEIDK